jgi:hypothetical protein
MVQQIKLHLGTFLKDDFNNTVQSSFAQIDIFIIEFFAISPSKHPRIFVV